MTDDFELIKAELEALNENEAKNKKEWERNKQELDQLQSKIERGEKLISGLGDEKIRWEKSLILYKE